MTIKLICNDQIFSYSFESDINVSFTLGFTLYVPTIDFALTTIDFALKMIMSLL